MDSLRLRSSSIRKNSFLSIKFGKERLWIASMDCIDQFKEDNNLDNENAFTYEQQIDLPIQVLSNKEHDIVEYKELNGLLVRHMRLRGTKVFGNGSEVQEMEFFDEQIITLVVWTIMMSEI